MGRIESGPPDIERIVGEYGTSLLRMNFLYLKDYHLAEDAMQDTLIKVYENYAGFKGESSERTWITRIAVNTCKNYLRSSWRKRVDGAEALEQIPAEEADLQDDALLATVMDLPNKYREIILLYYYQELRVREIAEVLRIPEATVSTRLKRARERLKKSWKGEFFE